MWHSPLYQELLPLCAAVVHHGGIGTTARALAAGTPQLVLPLAWDQPDNAARVRRLGAGSSLGARHRSAARLGEALAEQLKPEAQARCRALGARFGDDDAFERAAAWLHGLDRSIPVGNNASAGSDRTSIAEMHPPATGRFP